jgi:hypothetical protein
MKNRFILILVLFAALLASCAPVDLNAPIPAYNTGIDPNSWAQIPAGEFYFGQHEDIESTDAYEIMVTDVTTQQYADYLNVAVADGTLKIKVPPCSATTPATHLTASITRSKSKRVTGNTFPWLTRRRESNMTESASRFRKDTRTIQ